MVELNSIKFEIKKLKTEKLRKNKEIEELEMELSNIKKDDQSVSDNHSKQHEDDYTEQHDMPSLLKGPSANKNN